MTSSSDGEIPVPISNEVFIDGLSSSVSSHVLKCRFKDCGPVSSVKILGNRSGAFVSFYESKDAVAALQKSGTKLMDDVIRVVLSHTRKERTSRTWRCRNTDWENSSQWSRRSCRLRRRPIHYNEVILFDYEDEEENDDSNYYISKYDIVSTTIASYPHLAECIFSYLDRVSLIRCRDTCTSWKNFITKCLNSSNFKRRYSRNWESGNCSLSALRPSKASIRDYRNVLSVVADSTDIMVALDNGYVEIYDRFTRSRKCVLIRDYFSSPDTLDFNSDIILVSYTLGFGGGYSRRTSPSFSSTGVYCLYDRKTKRLLKDIPRSEKLRIGFDKSLYVIHEHSIERIQNYVGQRHLFLSTLPHEIIESLCLDQDVIVLAVRSSGRLMIQIWKKPCPIADSIASFYIFSKDDSFENSYVMSLEVNWPYALLFLSNNAGNFERYISRKNPHVLLLFVHLLSQVTIRKILLDENWMCTHKIVPFDSDSCVLSTKFNHSFVVVGFGSFANRNDGGIAVWKMSEILNPTITNEKLSLRSLPSPFYHWNNLEGHTGGVSSLHLDDIGLIAANSCSHRIKSRCIENYDEIKKDNIIIYDFWEPGKDLRQNHQLNSKNPL